jgi:hypothetical protein
MARTLVSTFVAAATVLVLGGTAARATGAPSDRGYAYPPPWYYWHPGSPERIYQSPEAAAKVLDAINSAGKRNQLAEEWLQFSKQSVAQSHQFRQDWLNLQDRLLRRQEQMEQLRLEMLRLQMEIERLRAENLRLEKENLQLQLELQKHTGQHAPSEPPQKAQSPSN